MCVMEVGLNALMNSTPVHTTLAKLRNVELAC